MIRTARRCLPVSFPWWSAGSPCPRSWDRPCSSPRRCRRAPPPRLPARSPRPGSADRSHARCARRFGDPVRRRSGTPRFPKPLCSARHPRARWDPAGGRKGPKAATCRRPTRGVPGYRTRRRDQRLNKRIPTAQRPTRRQPRTDAMPQPYPATTERSACPASGLAKHPGRRSGLAGSALVQQKLLARFFYPYNTRPMQQPQHRERCGIFACRARASPSRDLLRSGGAPSRRTERELALAVTENHRVGFDHGDRPTLLGHLDLATATGRSPDPCGAEPGVSPRR